MRAAADIRQGAPVYLRPDESIADATHIASGAEIVVAVVDPADIAQAKRVYGLAVMLIPLGATLQQRLGDPDLYLDGVLAVKAMVRPS